MVVGERRSDEWRTVEGGVGSIDEGPGGEAMGESREDSVDGWLFGKA